MRQEDFTKILEIGVSLSSERDLNRLLERILRCVMELTRCDAGTLYLLEGEDLHFKISRNNTLKNYSNGEGMPPVPLTRSSVSALSILEDKTICIDDVKNCREYDLTGPRSYDKLTGYDTRSMLVVPMRNREGEHIGVLQLINALDTAGQVRPFDPELVLAVESVASQAAITVQNVRYLDDIKELFHSFVKVMSTAIDQRSPYNANHSRRMASNGGRFADYLNARAARDEAPLPFTPQHREELVMSIWLHDIGKVTTPLEVMDKARRLSPLQEALIRERLRQAALLGRIRELEGALTPAQREAEDAFLAQAARLIEEINGAGFVTGGQLSSLDGIKAHIYTDEGGQARPLLTEEEYAMLSIRKGTLSPAERKVMEDHVVVTDKLLSQIKFSKDLSHVRSWASAHHEKLNGRGYPHGLKGEEIPFEVRIITILDIFDALVADDRPYKPGKTAEEAIKILGFMVKDGELDPELTRLFIESRCWEG